MNPSLDDRLASMARAMGEVILPALIGAEGLAEEQTSLLLGHRNQLRSQIDLVSRYEAVQLAGYIELARALCDGAEGDSLTMASFARLREFAERAAPSRLAVEERFFGISGRRSKPSWGGPPG